MILAAMPPLSPRQLSDLSAMMLILPASGLCPLSAR
jgi:hypothetical protein